MLGRTDGGMAKDRKGPGDDQGGESPSCREAERRYPMISFLLRPWTRTVVAIQIMIAILAWVNSRL